MDGELLPITEATADDLQAFFCWFIQCGRGFGKTWTGGQWVNERARNATGRHIGLMGRDASDVREFMVEGESGILPSAPNDFRPLYESSKKRITWPNGVEARIFYAEEPDTVRGPNNFCAWVDEPASFRDAHLGLQPSTGKATAMSNLLMTLRKGSPQMLVTGTPRPVALIKDLLKMPGTIVVRGGTRENEANLTPAFFKHVVDRYEGTRLGRQEIEGEVLTDNPGALWQREWIERSRIPAAASDMERVAIAVDPATTANENSDETGIVVVGKRWHEGEERDHFYVFADLTTKGTPLEWGRAVDAGYSFWKADVAVAEANNGGDMVISTLTNVNPNMNARKVHASRGKITRAEPVSALYEQNRVHHVGPAGAFVALEDQMCEWEPGQPSPDRMDALVWGVTELMDDEGWSVSSEDHAEFFSRSGPEPSLLPPGM